MRGIRRSASEAYYQGGKGRDQKRTQYIFHGFVARKAIAQNHRPPRSASRLTGAMVFRRPYILRNAA